MKRMMSSLMRICRSISATAAAGASMFSSVKCALRFFLMRKARDLRPQYSTLVTAPPSESMIALELLRQRLDLLRRNVLARQEDMLVESHDAAFPFHRAPREPFEP